MNIGIFTYGTRGDVQPYIALALGLMQKGHGITIAGPENFKDLVEGYGITFHALHGNAETMMNSPEGQSVLQTENTIKLMQYFFKVLHDIRVPLREGYKAGFDKVDCIIANAATLPITGAIAEKQNKKLALTYFMPPVVPTSEFPLGDFDFINFPWYNRLTYKLAHLFFWKFVKQETNEWRQELGLPLLKQNLLTHVDKQKPLDLYCISPALIPQPKDWESHHMITGFLTVPGQSDIIMDADLNRWLQQEPPPVYMGFGSNGVGNTEKFVAIINQILSSTTERILFCSGWSVFKDLPVHKNLFVAKYVDHAQVLPKCKVGIFHGGAGTLNAMLRHKLPVIIISFYTDQPTWGKIVERKHLGLHIPVKKLTADKLISAIGKVQSATIKANLEMISQQIRNEDGLARAVEEIEGFFGKA